MRLDEAIEYLEEAASGPFLAAFNKDTQVFPIKLRAHNFGGMGGGGVSIEVITAAGKTLRAVTTLATLRAGKLAKTLKVGKSKADTRFGILRFPDDRGGLKPVNDSIKLLQALGQKLGVKAGARKLGLTDAKEEKEFQKSYPDLESLSDDIDKIAK